MALAGCATQHQDVARPLPPVGLQDSAAAASSPEIRQVAYLSSYDPRAIPKPLPTSDPPAAATSHAASDAAPADDPKQQFLPAMTLQQALAETLRADPKLHSAMEGIEQARDDLVTSALLPNPTLAVNGVYLPSRPFTAAAPGGPPELDVIGSWPIDWFLFGKRAAAIANARLGVEVSNADYCDQVRQRLAGTAAAFFSVLEAQAMLEESHENLANLKRVESITRQGVKLGGAGAIEADRIRLSVLDAQRDVRTREATLVTNKAQLRAAIGRGLSAPGFEVAGSLEVPAPAAPPSAAEAVTLAEQNRPDIISLRTQVAKARSAIRVEKTKAFPSVTPSFGTQEQYQESQGSPNALGYTATLSVTMPLFDRNQGNVRKAESALAQSSFDLQAQLVQAHAEIEQAVAEFQAARADVVAIGPEQLQAARSVRDRTESAYRVGGKTLLELIDAERAYCETHCTYITAQSNYWHALYRLNAAIGKEVLK
jgi:cobalt-zinc-cadmium efflux system outer membrane protein